MDLKICIFVILIVVGTSAALGRREMGRREMGRREMNSRRIGHREMVRRRMARGGMARRRMDDQPQGLCSFVQFHDEPCSDLNKLGKYYLRGWGQVNRK